MYRRAEVNKNCSTAKKNDLYRKRCWLKKMMVGACYCLAWSNFSYEGIFSCVKFKPNSRTKLSKIYPAGQNSTSVRRVQQRSSAQQPKHHEKLYKIGKISHGTQQNRCRRQRRTSSSGIRLETRKDKRKTVSDFNNVYPVASTMLLHLWYLRVPSNNSFCIIAFPHSIIF